MIINLWSTPRTGSNWYTSYLVQEQEKISKKVLAFHQYLNYFHFINYSKSNHSDWVYSYSKNCTYPDYQYDFLRQSVVHTYTSGPRIRNPNEEEEYRINLLEKHNHIKNNLVLHNHILPMSSKAYDYLFRKADKNIFLYRENIIDQLSSYALAYTTGVWKPNKTKKIYENIKTEEAVIKNLFDRILYWHSLDKTNCDVIKYEDIDFQNNVTIKIPKQNIVKPFLQLHPETQSYIQELNEEFIKYHDSKKTLLPS